jgi:hypothetical protein
LQSSLYLNTDNVLKKVSGGRSGSPPAHTRVPQLSLETLLPVFERAEPNSWLIEFWYHRHGFLSACRGCHIRLAF